MFKFRPGVAEKKLSYISDGKDSRGFFILSVIWAIFIGDFSNYNELVFGHPSHIVYFYLILNYALFWHLFSILDLVKKIFSIIYPSWKAFFRNCCFLTIIILGKILILSKCLKCMDNLKKCSIDFGEVSLKYYRTSIRLVKPKRCLELGHYLNWNHVIHSQIIIRIFAFEFKSLLFLLFLS